MSTKEGEARWNKRIRNNALWNPNVMHRGINTLSMMLCENWTEMQSTSAAAKYPHGKSDYFTTTTTKYRESLLLSIALCCLIPCRWAVNWLRFHNLYSLKQVLYFRKWQAVTKCNKAPLHCNDFWVLEWNDVMVSYYAIPLWHYLWAQHYWPTKGQHFYIIVKNDRQTDRRHTRTHTNTRKCTQKYGLLAVL